MVSSLVSIIPIGFWGEDIQIFTNGVMSKDTSCSFHVPTGEIDSARGSTVPPSSHVRSTFSDGLYHDALSSAQAPSGSMKAYMFPPVAPSEEVMVKFALRTEYFVPVVYPVTACRPFSMYCLMSKNSSPRYVLDSLPPIFMVGLSEYNSSDDEYCVFFIITVFLVSRFHLMNLLL